MTTDMSEELSKSSMMTDECVEKEQDVASNKSDKDESTTVTAHNSKEGDTKNEAEDVKPTKSSGSRGRRKRWDALGGPQTPEERLKAALAMMAHIDTGFGLKPGEASATDPGLNEDYVQPEAATCAGSDAAENAAMPSTNTAQVDDTKTVAMSVDSTETTTTKDDGTKIDTSQPDNTDSKTSPPEADGTKTSPTQADGSKREREGASSRWAGVVPAVVIPPPSCSCPAFLLPPDAP